MQRDYKQRDNRRTAHRGSKIITQRESQTKTRTRTGSYEPTAGTDGLPPVELAELARTKSELRN